MKHLIKSLVKEQLETKLFESSLNDLILICENEDNGRTFEWDVAQEQLEKTISTIHTNTR